MSQVTTRTSQQGDAGSSSDVCHTIDSDDDDVQIILERGSSAATTYSHFHYMCGYHRKSLPSRSAEDSLKFCSKCYCYACDVPVNECADWTSHCLASPSDSWDLERSQIRKRRSSEISSMSGAQLLNDLRQTYWRTMSAPSISVPLYVHQMQTLAWMFDREENGLDMRPILGDFGSPLLSHGGIVADEMGMGKTVTVIALMTLSPRRVFTLVIAPPYLLLQWKTDIERYSPLTCTCLYGDVQGGDRLGATGEVDVLIVGAGCKFDVAIWNRVERVVVDEAHLVLCPRSNFTGKVLDFVRRGCDKKYKWLITGTPWVNVTDAVVSCYLLFLSGIKTGHRYLSASANEFKKIIMRHTMDQTVQHTDGSMLPCLSLPHVKQKILSVELSEHEQKLYKLACCSDSKNQQSTFIHLNNLSCVFRHRLMVANGYVDEFVREYVDRDMSNYIPMGDSHEYIEETMNLHADLFSSIGSSHVHHNSKARALLDDMNSRCATTPSFRAVVICAKPQVMGSWLNKSSTFAVLVAQECKGKIKKRAQKDIRAFQESSFDVFVCSYDVTQTGVNLHLACTVYFADLQFDLTKYYQSLARTRRIGVKHSDLDAVFVISKGTVHEAIMQWSVQNDKRDTVSACPCTSISVRRFHLRLFPLRL